MTERDVKMLLLGAGLALGARWAVDHPEETERALNVLMDVSLDVLAAVAETSKDPMVRAVVREQLETRALLASRD